MTCAASRISAISCALLIMRHPAVTGVALAIFACDAALRMPSANTNRTVSSIPSLPVAMPRSFNPCAMRSIRALVFLPHAHVGLFAVGRVGDLFARASLFKRRANIKCRALGGQHQRERSARRPTSECR